MAISHVQIGQRVREAMTAAGISQADLAAELGMDQAQVSRRLSGFTPFRAHEIARAAPLLRKPLAYFFPKDSPGAPITPGGTGGSPDTQAEDEPARVAPQGS